MNITNEKDFKKELKKCYKDGSNFSMVLYTLMFGDENHKDLKEAYKLLKHEEKNKNSKVEKKNIYNNLFLVCTSLNSTDEARDYKEKYYRCCLSSLTDKRSKIEGLKTMTDICFNKAFNLKNKLVDKIYLQDAINYFLLYLKEVKNINYLYLKERTNQLIKETFSSDKYGHKKLYLAHIIDNRNKELIKSFTQSDYIDYYLLLKDKEISLDYDKDLLKYLKVVSEYKFLKKDNESALEYARYHLSHPRFIYAKEDYFSLINCVYNLGNKDAFKDICKYYLDKFDKDKVYKALQLHHKKYKDDKENLITCCFDILSKFVVNNTPIKDAIKCVELAIKILEENNDYLSKEQLEKLSNIYEKGIGVKKDINKVKLYKNYNSNSKEIDKDVKLLLSKVIPLNEYYKDEVNEIINKMMDGKEEDVFNAISLIAYGDRAKKDHDLLFLLLNKYVSSYPTLTPLLAGCYLMGVGVKRDIDKYNELRDICLKNNYEDIDQIHYDYFFDDAKKNGNAFEFVEMLEEEVKKGNNYAKYKLIKLMIENVYLAYDIDKINKLLLELEKAQYYRAFAYISVYYMNIEQFDKAFECAKKKADLCGHPTTYRRLYNINLKNNFKYMNKKETLTCLLKASAYDPKGDINYDLALHYINGDLCAKNYEKALKCLLKSAEMDYQSAIIYLLSIYQKDSNEFKTKKDLDLAYSYYQRIFDENKVDKFYRFLINLYLDKNSKHHDPKKGMDLLLRKYEETKDPVLAYELFYQYDSDINVKRDIEKAEHYIKLAMESGSEAAYYAYGLFLISRKYESIKTIEEGLKLMKRISDDKLTSVSASIIARYSYFVQKYKDCYHYASLALKRDSNNGLANHYLGVLYAEGKHVEKDLKIAEKYLIKAIENGETLSYYSLALIIFITDPFDEKRFLELINKDLEANNSETHNLYCDYLVYRKKEYKKAYEYIEDHFDILEYSRIRGDMFYYGYYVSVDFAKAFEIYTSLENPAPKTLANIGFCYYYGRGVKEDKRIGIEYIKRSAIKNCKDAIDFLKENNIPY